MVGGHERRVDLAALRTLRHDRRPSGAVFLAQCGCDDRGYLLILGEDEPERLVEMAAAVHLARAHQLVLNLDRFEEPYEQGDHVRGEAVVAITERVGDPGDGFAEIRRVRFAVEDAFGNLAQAVHVVDKDNEAVGAVDYRFIRESGTAERVECVADVGWPQHLAHRAEMGQSRGAEAAFKYDWTPGVVGTHTLGKPARLLVRPEVELRVSLRSRCHPGASPCP